MKPILTFVLIVLLLFIFTSCGSDEPSEVTYKKITAEAAKELMDSDDTLFIVDVRTQEEYDTGHIPNAILLPLDTLADKASEVLPDKEQRLLIYCRSGNRSATAAKQLIEMGYTEVYDFGGIIDWPFDVE